MEKHLVTVIIPAYNTAPYIKEMLECVIHQTYRNLEIIIVNDGSTDNTLSVILDEAKQDKRITVMNIPNGGVSNARNVAIDKAHGDKIFFWDSDDVVELETIEKCLAFSDKHQVNAVLYGYSNRTNGINGPQHSSSLKSIYRNEAIVKELVPHFLGHSFEDVNNWIEGKQGLREGKESTALWRIMCDAKTIKDHRLEFDRNLSLGEDTTFINSYFLYETSVGYLDECLYHLAQREDGANLSSILNADKRITDKTKLIYTRLDIDKIAKERHKFDTHKFWEGTLVFSGVEMALRMAKNQRGTIMANYRKYYNFINIPAMQEARSSFHPSRGIKSIPFQILRGGEMLFFLFLLCPERLLRRLMP